MDEIGLDREIVVSKKGSMKLAWSILGVLCLGQMAFAGGKALVEPSLTPSAENLGSLWSFELNGEYTFGSHVEKTGNLGSQAEYRYEIEALRNFRITGDYYLQLGRELLGNSYRNGPTNDRRTNNAILEYSEERAGIGVDYTLRKGIDLEAIAGWTIERVYDYIRSGPINRSRGSPYIRLDLKIDLF